MQLKIRKTKQTIVLSASGKLDGSTAWQIKHALDHLRKNSRMLKLQVDFKCVRQWERFGVAILAKHLKSLAAHFQEVTLTGVDDMLGKSFKSVGLGTDILAADV